MQAARVGAEDKPVPSSNMAKEVNAFMQLMSGGSSKRRPPATGDSFTSSAARSNPTRETVDSASIAPRAPMADDAGKKPHGSVGAGLGASSMPWGQHLCLAAWRL